MTIKFYDLRRPNSNELFGIKPWGVNYYPIVLRLVKDQDGKDIDIDVRLEMSGTYTAEQMDELLKAVIIAKNIRQKMLIELDIRAERIELTTQESIDKTLGLQAHGVYEQPKLSCRVDGKHYFEPTLVLIQELLADKNTRDWMVIEKNLQEDFLKQRDCKGCDDETEELDPCPKCGGKVKPDRFWKGTHGICESCGTMLKKAEEKVPLPDYPENPIQGD